RGLELGTLPFFIRGRASSPSLPASGGRLGGESRSAAAVSGCAPRGGRSRAPKILARRPRALVCAQSRRRIRPGQTLATRAVRRRGSGNPEASGRPLGGVRRERRRGTR